MPRKVKSNKEILEEIFSGVRQQGAVVKVNIQQIDQETIKFLNDRLVKKGHAIEIKRSGTGLVILVNA